jgi:hypothetical protein
MLRSSKVLFQQLLGDSSSLGERTGVSSSCNALSSGTLKDSLRKQRLQRTAGRLRFLAT